METKKFKAFDRVLVKVLTDEKWTPDLYSYYDDIKNLHWTIGCGWASDDNILPYEGNEHLVGTDLPAEEEIMLEEGEWIMCAARPYNCADDWALRQFDQTREKAFHTVNGDLSSYAIRFSDFNPSNMEETRKHILCVKNGKIVKYRENNKLK